MGRPRKTSASVNIEIAVAGGTVVMYNFDHKPQVYEALERAGIDSDASSRIRVNGEKAECDDVLEDGDTLTVTKKIKGG